MRISKTSSRATPKAVRRPARATAAARSKPKAQAHAAKALTHTAEPSQLSGLKLALQRLANGISKLDTRPLSANTAQGALSSLRGD